MNASGIVPIAWAEDGGSAGLSAYGLPNIEPAYYSAYFTQIKTCMSYGFAGYSEDIEQYTGTLQQWLWYLNNETVMLHGLGKLCMPACPYDWQQDINPYLHVDFILSMFYSDYSTFEDPQGPVYWQENFGVGVYAGLHPASPVILGIMNCYVYNEYPLSWQLAQCADYMNSYGAPNLRGFSIWLYEYMCAQNANDWMVWNSWITYGNSNEPIYSNVTDSSTVAGSSSSFSVIINDAAALQPNGQYQFGTNNTGTWIWNPPINFTSTPQTLSVTITLNSNVGYAVAYEWNYTDNSSNAENTGIQTLTTTGSSPTPTPTPTPTPSPTATPTSSLGGDGYVSTTTTTPTPTPTPPTPTSSSTATPTSSLGGDGYVSTTTPTPTYSPISTVEPMQIPNYGIVLAAIIVVLTFASVGLLFITLNKPKKRRRR
jgi:hypothetical protein